MDMSLALLLTMGFLASAVMLGLSQAVAVAVVVARRRIRK